jgi:hypothetical protein
MGLVFEVVEEEGVGLGVFAHLGDDGVKIYDCLFVGLHE